MSKILTEEIILNSVKETIREYEYLTAGRHYEPAQKKAIFALVARANMLDKEREKAIERTLFSAEFEEYENETDCANGLLMASLYVRGEYSKQILEYRKQFLTDLSDKCIFKDKTKWLQYVFSGIADFNHILENAVYMYAVNQPDKALRQFERLAEYCHGLSVKLAIALCRELGETGKELRYLIILNRITESLYYDKLPEAFKARMDEIRGALTENEIRDANEKKIYYFDESVELGRMGFRA